MVAQLGGESPHKLSTLAFSSDRMTPKEKALILNHYWFDRYMNIGTELRQQGVEPRDYPLCGTFKRRCDYWSREYKRLREMETPYERYKGSRFMLLDRIGMPIKPGERIASYVCFWFKDGSYAEEIHREWDHNGNQIGGKGGHHHNEDNCTAIYEVERLIPAGVETCWNRWFSAEYIAAIQEMEKRSRDCAILQENQTYHERTLQLRVSRP